MKIAGMVLKAQIDQMVKMVEGFDFSIHQDIESLEIMNSRKQLQAEVDRLNSFRAGVELSLITDKEGAELVKSLKSSIRVAMRNFKKAVSNQIRIRKTQERKLHVSTFAA